MFILKLIVEAFLITLLFTLFLATAGFFVYLKFKPKKAKKTDTPTISDTTRVIMTLSNIIEDKEKPSVFSLQKNDEVLSLSEITDGLKKLLDYPHIKEVILNIDDSKVSAVHIEELQPLFQQLNTQKKVTAFASSYHLNNYHLALLAQNITLLNSKQASISFIAPSYQETYLKKFFDRFGFRFHVLHLGDYKLAGENLSHQQMSSQKEQVVCKQLQQKLDYIVHNIQSLRGISSIKEQILNGDLAYLNGAAALEQQLIDQVLTFQEIDLDDTTHTLSFEQFIQKVQSETKKNKSKKSEDKPEIALLCLEGEIGSQKSLINRKQISAKMVQEKLDLIDSSTIKALVLRINSPGGSALESEKIYQTLKKLEIPIYISMGTYAASGGYEIACVGKKIFANTQTLTGSIGVVAMIPEVAGTLEKMEITVQEQHLGRYNDLESRILPLSEDSKQLLLQSMEDCYLEFKEHVLTSRSIETEELEEIAQGKVWNGMEAKENGLIDEIGTLDDCIQAAINDLSLTNDAVEILSLKHNITDKLHTLIPLLKATTETNWYKTLLPTNEIRYYEPNFLEE